METTEDYVEAVAELIESLGKCRVTDLARKFAVSHVTVSKTVTRLIQAGFLQSAPYGPVELTRKGKKLAEESRTRHEIVYRFLLSIGVSDAVAQIDTEGIEHHVSPETLKCLERITNERLGS
jgi:DtxR family manganese transport transcriptional regulator